MCLRGRLLRMSPRLTASSDCRYEMRKGTYRQANSHHMQQTRLTSLNQLRHTRAQPLRQAREQVERHDDESAVGLIDEIGLLLKLLVLLQRRLDDGERALVHGLAIRRE